MPNHQIVKNFIAEAAVARHRIVKLGAADDQVVQGAASTDALIGVSTQVDSALGARCDIVLTGQASVTYGGNVARGDLLTSDANGKAVAAAPGAGVNARIVGHALVAGVADDIGEVVLSPGRIQG